MSRLYSYLNTAATILKGYAGPEPFSSFSKKYFAQHKKHGSTDRKKILELCYNYFRLGKAFGSLDIEKRLSWVSENIDLKDSDVNATDIFPWADKLSEGIDQKAFAESFLIQPDLYLRIRPGMGEKVKNKLNEARIEFKEISKSCIALPNTSKVDQYLSLDREVVIQDMNSQRVGEFFPDLKKGDKVWDCCAGSGGKSILLFDLRQDIDLFVSDNRVSIISNLKNRFREAGIKKFDSALIDLTNPEIKLSFAKESFYFILADVPCTGSGTWSRTPEQLFFFNEKKIAEYSMLQKKILSNTIPFLKPGGHILYSTCSVLKEENEENIEFIREKFKLRLVKQDLLAGYNQKADTLFAALMEKPL